ncbi:hypothetical protein [Streptomyces sp. LARHCF252]
MSSSTEARTSTRARWQAAYWRAEAAAVLSSGWQSGAAAGDALRGVTMHRPNEPGYSHPDA